MHQHKIKIDPKSTLEKYKQKNAFYVAHAAVAAQQTCE